MIQENEKRKNSSEAYRNKNREEIEKFKGLITSFVTLSLLPKKDLMEKAATIWGAYNQFKWERDIALSQLQELGIGLGENVDDLKRLIELNDQGLLVELPLKPGEQFYELNDNYTSPTIYPRWAHSLMHCLYCKERLGKTCFLTKEDGEKFLKKLEKEKGNDES